MCSLTSPTDGQHDLGEVDRPAPAPGRLRPGQDDQVLGVAPHPGGQVVQLAQPGPDLGLGAAALQLVDHLELALDQALAAPGQVEEHVADAVAQGRLAAGHPDRDPVHRVERLGQVADLVPGADLDGRADSAARSTCSPSWSRWTTPGSRRVAVSSAAVSSRRIGRIRDRAVIRARATASARAAARSRLYSQARRSAPCLTAELVAITSALRRSSTVRMPVELDAHGVEPELRVDAQPRVALALARALSTKAATLSTSGPATVSSKNSCWASVALESNWAV